MSAIAATVQALLADSGIGSIVAARVWPVIAPQVAELPNVIVYMVSEDDEMLLRGTAGFPEARVSVECRAATFTAANALGEAVKTALLPLHRAAFAGVLVSFAKASTDLTDFADDTRTHRRILDFYARWQ